MLILSVGVKVGREWGICVRIIQHQGNKEWCMFQMKDQTLSFYSSSEGLSIFSWITFVIIEYTGAAE